jgi:anti-sigma B factor antagonist
MALDIEKLPNCTVISLVGHLTGSITSRIYDQILTQVQAKQPRVILDLSGVTYLSSAALRLLLSLYRVIDSREGMLVLAGMSEDVNDILNITGFSDLFRSYKDRATALAMLR